METEFNDFGSGTSIFWSIFEEELRKGQKFRFFMDFIVFTDISDMR